MTLGPAVPAAAIRTSLARTTWRSSSAASTEGIASTGSLFGRSARPSREVSTAETMLRDHVRQMATSSNGTQLDVYLEAHGRFFVPAPLPPGSPQLMHAVLHQADCYMKSRLLAQDDQSLDYAEGWALAPDGVPTRHAWCVDPEGRVVDAEWPTPEALTYFGVVVPRSFGYAWRGTFTPAHALAIQDRDSS